MHRRDVLAALAGTATASGFLGAAAGSPSSATGSSAPTTGSRSSAIGSSSTDAGAGDAQEAYEPLGSVDLDGTRELATSEDGTVGYAAVDDGIATIDFSAPTDPSVLAERRGFFEDHREGPLQLIWDAWPDDDRLLAAGPAQQIAGSDLNGALLFDVSDPADPQLLDRHRTDFSIHNAFFEDGYAYLTGNGARGNPLVVLDASEDQLEEVGRWSLLDHEEEWGSVNSGLRQLHDLYVQDDLAYLAYWDAGTYLLDVSDPADPTYVSHVSEFEPSDFQSMNTTEVVLQATGPPGNSHYVQVDETGDLMVVGRESWGSRRSDCIEGGPSGVDLYDVSDPTDPIHRSEIRPPKSALSTRQGQFTTSHNVDVVDGRLYSSWYFGGVKVHDVSDPAEPEELAWWRQPDEAVFWTAQSGVPGEYFVASSADEAAGFAESVQGRIYVFPDRAGEQANPPSLMDGPGSEQTNVPCWVLERFRSED